MPRASVGDLEFEYEVIGSEDDPAVLLVMGLGAQLIHWHEDFCQMIADRGFKVIRFDNRDSGLSSKLDGVDIDFLALVVEALQGHEISDIPYD